ncbi:hypothetical protein MAR_020963 [Mya arenaria]|uniref:Uncharacterized protein n=1 Tax=Mya arenaria TaxID=6604 RepID=A0ABY7E8S9_MYAAR|nr:hypothetical protein MAR_020963 [Mya arenaria]
MDQDKTSVPHLSTTPKSMSVLYTVKMNLMGAIAHGIGAYGFFDLFLWAHGSNYTICVGTFLVHADQPPSNTVYKENKEEMHVVQQDIALKQKPYEETPTQQ